MGRKEPGMTLSRGLDPRGSRASGFTLLEVLVTVVILSIGLVAVLRAYSAYVQALEKAGDVLISQLLIDEALDDVRFGFVGRQGLRPQEYTVEKYQGGIAYSVTTRVAPARRADHKHFYDVIITVSRGESREPHRLQTLVRRPLSDSSQVSSAR